MRIVVTGAAGFIGSHVAERLMSLGHQVLGLDSFTPYYSRLLKDLNAAAVSAAGAELVTCDLASDDLRGVLDGCEFVYHLAAQPGISARTPFSAYARNNIDATQRLLAALEDCGTLRGLAYASTSSVYGAYATFAEDEAPKPISWYGVTKLAAEQLVMASHRSGALSACSLRLFSVYGERERPEKLYPRLITSILHQIPFPLYEGSRQHRRSYTYVGDAVDAMVAALDHWEACEGEIINVGSDVSVSTGDGIDTMEDLLGRKAPILALPPRPGDQTETCADIGKARRILGYNPTTTLREGLRREVAWYRREVLPNVPPSVFGFPS